MGACFSMLRTCGGNKEKKQNNSTRSKDSHLHSGNDNDAFDNVLSNTTTFISPCNEEIDGTESPPSQINESSGNFNGAFDNAENQQEVALTDTSNHESGETSEVNAKPVHTDENNQENERESTEGKNIISDIDNKTRYMSESRSKTMDEIEQQILTLRQKLDEREKKKRQNEHMYENVELPTTSTTQIDENETEPKQISAPSTNKESLYMNVDITLFSDLERHAVHLISSDVTFDALMESLFIDELSDLEKVRILFHWITAQNLNSIEFPSSVDEDSLLGYLKAIKENKKSYAALFQRLCNVAGVPSKTIQGYMKGVSYFPDHKFLDEPDLLRGSWNAVFINGQWMLVDTDWGARSLIEDFNIPWERWNTKYCYDEHYFLTDPENLIYSHFPDQTEWQLLQQPVTLDNFQETVQQWSLFYKLKLFQVSHRKGIVTTDHRGYVQIKLGISDFARSDAVFKGKLLKKENDASFSTVGQRVFHYSTHTEEVFEIFLPEPGKFFFQLYATSLKFCENHYSYICRYQIECQTINSTPDSNHLPPFPEADCYGPNQMMTNLGLTTKSHPGPTVLCDENGEATIVLSVPASESSLTFSHNVKSVTSECIENTSVHTLTPDENAPEFNNLTVFVRVPSSGNFLLTLYGGQHDSTTLSPFCFYFINSTKQTRVLTFPKVSGKSIGKKEQFSRLNLEVVSCSVNNGKHWLTPTYGEAFYTFRHSEPLKFISKLISAVGRHDDFVTVFSDGNLSTILIRVPPSLNVGEVLLLEIYAGLIKETEGIPLVFSTFIFVSENSEQVFPFPSTNRGWGPTASFFSCDVKSVKCCNSTSAFTPTPSVTTTFYQRYDGGSDMEILLDHFSKLTLRPHISKYNDANKERCENYSFVTFSSARSSTICVRFCDTGLYTLDVYGEKYSTESGESLGLLFNILILVSQPSNCRLSFPVAFNLWEQNEVRLLQPLQSEIVRNRPISFQLSLGRCENTQDEGEVVPFHKVLLLSDDGTPNEANKQNGCEYEWLYVAGPGEKKVYVAVKTLNEDKVYRHVLQYKVVP